LVFAEKAAPLEARLRGLPPERSKVVVAVVDAPELARGVRTEILRLRRELGAVVLVIYVGELRKLQDDERRRRFFSERLAEAVRLPRPFSRRAPLREPADFVGNRHVVDNLVSVIEQRDSLMLVSIRRRWCPASPVAARRRWSIWPIWNSRLPNSCVSAARHRRPASLRSAV
jgi:hypothetical protein